MGPRLAPSFSRKTSGQPSASSWSNRSSQAQHHLPSRGGAKQLPPTWSSGTHRYMHSSGFLRTFFWLWKTADLPENWVFWHFPLSFDKIIEFSENVVLFLKKFSCFSWKSSEILPNFWVFGNKIVWVFHPEFLSRHPKKAWCSYQKTLNFVLNDNCGSTILRGSTCYFNILRKIKNWAFCFELPNFIA